MERVPTRSADIWDGRKIRSKQKGGGQLSHMIYCSADPADITGAPKEIKLLPRGMVKSQKGDFLVDEKSFEAMKQEFESRKLDKVIDYEHQTLADVQAPAAGWIKRLKLTDEAVVAEVEWNPKAQEYLKNKEYRYLSPVVKVRQGDHRAVMLHSAALTNTPAIDGMFAVNKLELIDEDDDFEGGDEMDFKQIAVMLGLPEDADEAQVLEALKVVLGEMKTLKETKAPAADGVVCKLLDLKEDAKTEDLTAAIMALKGTGETVSKVEYLALKERLDKQDADSLVELALKSGKISPAMKPWAEEYALKDPSGFQAFTEKAPAVVPLKELSGVDTKQKRGTLDDETLIVCKAMGVSKEDLEKYGKEEA